MSFIKNNSKLLILVLVALLIGGGFLYYNQVFAGQLSELESLRDENEKMEQEWTHLKQEFLVLDQRKEELKDIQMQTKSLEEKIPTYEVSGMMMSELMQYMDIYKYWDTSVKIEDNIKPNKSDEKKEYETRPATIKYTATYEDSIKFLEMLNRSYHMLTIKKYSINNEIQEDEESILNYLSYRNEIVETEILVHMHYKGTGNPETYPNFMEYLEKEENIFARPSGVLTNSNTSDKGTEGGIGKPDTETKKETRTTFNIHLADILRSGDNYSFSAYSPHHEPAYVGLTSSKDTKMEIIIRDTGYTCLIEDSEGNKNEKKIDARVENPIINLTSQIQNVMEIMPTASIYIRNYTSEVINVNMRGTSLENVLIYNENNQLVVPGTQSGKVAVIR